MENSAAECVRVAVNVRPLITQELLMGCTDCITVPPGEPQVQIGSHCFTFDYVYGSSGSPSSGIFDQCVAPLVDALFQGYNATVLAYGQTGSGKTYTMGTNYTGEGSSGGVIPNVMEAIFRRVEAIRDTEFLIRVSFIEIFKEEVFDLLDPNSVVKADGVGAKVAAPARVPIQIRETVHGGITLSGVNEPEVRNKEEMAGHLSRGSLARATGSTNMNSQSSRSHAIFTITMEQKKSGTGCDDFGDDILSAKLHLVDLAGSERAKRTGADGLRLKEGIHINKGLLALGNVISALGDEKKRKEGGHVPYRDSKLTRLLQDSLGGNSKTVMIACVSPAETNAEETLNTLKYANRARNIQNKAIVNRDPTTTQLQRMRSQIEQLQAELSLYRGDASAPFDEIQILKHKVSLLEASNAELQRELQTRQENCEHLSQRAFDAQVERDKLMMKIESARCGKSWDEIDSDSHQDIGLLNTYVSKVQELEGEIVRLKSFSKFKHTGLDYCIDSDDDRLCSQNVLFPPSEEFSSNPGSISEDLSDEIETEELQHSSRQEILDRELKELDKQLEQKEAEMKRVASGDTSVLKLHYEKKVQELEHEKKSLQNEIDQLKHNLAHISHASDGGTQKLKDDYLQKLTVLEAQVADLKKKQDAQAQLLKQKQKSDEAARRLHEEIQRIKNQKVHLQQKIKQESEQFRQWKASREKEVLQLKKEGRRNEYEMHKLKALNQRQKMVLQRKTEEANMATKRLKELLEARKASSGAGSSGPTFQAMMQAIEHELEMTVRVHEVRSAHDRQLEERVKMARELSRLKEELETQRHQNISDSTTMSPGAKNSRIEALKNMLSSSSSTLVSMATQLSEAEERERGFGGRGRWNHVRTLADAKTVMNHLFNLASSSRCSLRDREVALREKEDEIKELKDKVVKLSGLVRHLELQKAELIHQLKAQSSALKKHSERSRLHGTMDVEVSSDSPDLKQSKNGIRGSVTQMEDMDTSESEMETSDEEYSLPEEKEEASDYDWTGPVKKNSRNGRRSTAYGTGRRSIAYVNNVLGNSKSESCGEGLSDGNRNIGGDCCTCSRYSLCKTMKCQCRAARGLCGPSCGCMPTKCSNREIMIGKRDEAAELNDVENAGNGYNSDEEKNCALASHGALLLRSAFASQTADDHDDGEMKRKPLSDIGNTRAKSNAPKPNQRKQWRRETIQLVTNAPPPSTQPEKAEPEVQQKSEDGSASVADIPIKLPRAMQQPQSSSGNVLLRERNSDESEEPANKDATALPPPRRPRPPKPTDEKENYRG